MNTRALKTFGALAAAGLALAFSACGDDDSTTDTAPADTTAADTTAADTTAADTGGSASGGGGGTVTISADPSQIAFTSTEVDAPAGSDTIEFDNPSEIPHNVEIEDADGNEVAATDTISASSATTTADLEPGTYTFYCSVSDHREEGMEGTITVK